MEETMAEQTERDELTGAELLREAARLMRRRAEACASPRPWEAERHYGASWVVDFDPTIPWPANRETTRWLDFGPEYEHWETPADIQVFAPHAQHIASWHPAVALAVADWLDHEARSLAYHADIWQRPSAGIDQPPAVAHGKPERLAELVEHHFGRALAVARAYLAALEVV